MRVASRVRVALLAIALQPLGSPLAAQDSGPTPAAEAGGCDALPWTADSADVEVHLALGPAELPLKDWYGERRVVLPTAARRFEAILDAFRARFSVGALPARELELKRPLDAADLDYLKALDAGVPSLWNRTVFTLHQDGRVWRVTTDHASRSHTLDSLIVSTLEALGAEGVLAQAEPDPVQMRLEMRYSPNAAVATAPLGSIRVPRYHLKPAFVVAGSPNPKYPPELRDASVQGEVLVQLIVDTAGRADMKSATLLRASHFEFARAVFDVLPAFRFHIARINGCPAKQLVQMPFAFRLRR